MFGGHTAVIEVNARALRVDTEALRGPSKAAAPAPPRLRTDFRGSTLEVSLDTADVVRDVSGIPCYLLARKHTAVKSRDQVQVFCCRSEN
jgi:hypothetical protein